MLLALMYGPLGGEAEAGNTPIPPPPKIYSFIWHFRPSSGGGWGWPDSLCKPLWGMLGPCQALLPHSPPPVPLAELQAQWSDSSPAHTVPTPVREQAPGAHCVPFAFCAVALPLSTESSGFSSQSSALGARLCLPPPSGTTSLQGKEERAEALALGELLLHGGHPAGFIAPGRLAAAGFLPGTCPSPQGHAHTARPVPSYGDTSSQ